MSGHMLQLFPVSPAAMSRPQHFDSQLYHNLQGGLRLAEMGFMDHCVYQVLVQLFLARCILSKILLGTTLKREL